MIRLLLLFLPFLLFASNAILKLDTKGHTSLIGDILVTKNGDIISASDDKTIRVWDRYGNEKRKILGQIGVGPEGRIYAIALTHNEKYLAVGGYLAGKKLEDKTAIRIYNYKTGKLIKLLKSHKDIVLDLAISSDDRYLISGSGDNSVKIWDIKHNFRLIDTIHFHNQAVYGVKIIKNRGKYFAVTAGDDNKIALYDIQKRRVINSDTSNYKLRYLAMNPIKKHIAVCGYGKEIRIYDYNLNLLKIINSETEPTGLNYSPNGKYLIAGSGTYPRNINIYNVNRNYSLKSSFKKHTNLTMAVNFIDNHTAVSGGGNNFKIYIWNINTLQVKTKIEGVGNTVWSVGINGNNIAWGNTDNCKGKNCSKFEKEINLKNFKISSVYNQNFHRISTINGEYSLYHSKGGPYGFNDAVLNVYKNNKKIASIVRNSYNGDEHSCYGWYKNYIISGGMNGTLEIYDRYGQKIADLIGHTGTIWSIAVDGDKVVSGSSDQTIKVWNLKNLLNNRKYNEKYIQAVMKKYNVSRKRVIEYFKQKGYNDIYLPKKLYPMLNIFVTKNNDYVIWSKSGYYASSVGGDKYVGYWINQGPNREARYVSSDKFYKTYYRPDIIKYIWELGSEEKAIAYANRTKKVQKIDVVKSLPPVVTLLTNDTITTSKDKITIRYKIDSDTPIRKVIITQNGRKLDRRALRLKKSNGVRFVTIDLDDGINIISIQAKNRYAFSDAVYLRITKKSKTKNIFKPTLYILAIGVSKYKNSEYNLGEADKDAIAFAKMFEKEKGKIYKDVKVKILTNQNASKDDILDALDWIDKEVTSKDVAMIFIAGHGVNDEKGKYYFMPYNANVERLRRTGVAWYEIQDTISDLPSKVILLADTCHSGSIMGNRRDITGAIKSIVNSGIGSVIMTATTGSGYSYERREWGHGAFTKAILEGIGKDKADYDHDGVVTLKELDLYVTNRVKQLTKGKQKPTTIIPRSVPDFALSAE